MTQGADGRNVGRIDGWRRGSGAAMPLFHPHVLRDYALMHVVHPLKRQILQRESKVLLEKAMNN